MHNNLISEQEDPEEIENMMLQHINDKNIGFSNINSNIPKKLSGFKNQQNLPALLNSEAKKTPAGSVHIPSKIPVTGIKIK